MEIKEMSYKKKYAGALSYINMENFAMDFVAEKLGKEAAEELQKEWQKGIKSIPPSATDKEKYEIALANWAWMGGTAFVLVRDRLGEEGIEQLVRADVDALGKTVPGAAVLLIKFIKAISPGMAFNILAKQMINQVQLAGPVSVSEFSKKRVVVDLPHCHFLDYAGGEGVCLIGQKAPPIAFQEQFGIGIKFDRQGSSCKITLTLLSRNTFNITLNTNRA
ncbi:MAG: hypothetical protein PVJ08_07510 [Dehalococcoidia bacterium]